MKFFSYQHLDTDLEQFVLDIGSWEILHLSEDVEELRLIIHKHTIDVMLIHGLLGSFLFIPQQNFGIMINDLADAETNERLLEWLPDSTNAVAISAALSDYAS